MNQIILFLFYIFRVIVLDNGRISEFDSPTNLLQKRDSQFWSMAKDAGLVA